MSLKPKLQGKRWKKESEKKIYEKWKETTLYKFITKSNKPVYSIDTPPPYVNRPVHVGQATTYVLMDFFARFRRMCGFNVLFPLGLDMNGLPIEMAVEQRFNIKLNDVPREEFLKKCEIVLKESSLASVESFLRLGISFNSWKIGDSIGDIYETDSPEYRKLTQETFIDLWKKGLIYEGKRVNNYCPGCQTTIADAEIDYAKRKSSYTYIVFKVKETGEDIIIATTRPELVCTCALVIFNPNDDKHKHLEGKTAITPLFNKEVKITAHPIADLEKGTGLAMMCSFGDLSDIRFFREMNLKPVIAITKDGRMNEHAGFLKDLTVKEAREKFIEELKKNKLLVKQIETLHRTPICERSKDEIEFIAMPEFYLKQLEFKTDMKKMAHKMNFYSEKSRQILLDWINSVSIDWPISRRRYYATEIPLWYCKKCSKTIVPPKGKYYQPWKEKPPIEKCDCGSKEFKGEERVFDTWFDSSISPLYILKYSNDDKFFEKNIPCSLRPQGKEIIRTWLYYTILKDYLLTDKCIFQDVWINYHILDGKGHKMSKSLGNIIDPKDILDKFSAEPFRLWAAIEGDLTKIDFKCSFDRIEGAAKFLTKLWNIARFCSMFYKNIEKNNPELTETDKWILLELNKLVKYTKNRYDNYDFHGPASRIKHFVWELFASHYIELVKSRTYNQKGKFSKNEQESGIYTLNKMLDVILKLLAPIIHFITYQIYNELNSKDIHFETFPESDEKILKTKLPFKTEELIELNSKIWKAKKDKDLPLNSDIKELIIPENFKPISSDLIETHKINSLKYGKNFEIKL